MRSLTLIISLLSVSGIYAQSLTASFNEDGSFQFTDEGRLGTSIQKVDADGRTSASIHYFAGGQRLRMSTEYTYANNLLTEQIGYIYTEGYDKDVWKFNSEGNSIDKKSFVSQDQSTWKEEVHLQSEYDHKQNRTYFRSRSVRAGFVNLMSRTTYNYSTGQRKVIEERYDKSDRLISTQNYGGKMGDYAMANGPYVFNEETDGSNLRPNRVIDWKGTDESGYYVEKVYMNSMVLRRTYDDDGRLIQLADGRPTYDDEHNLYYKYDWVIDYTYKNNKIIEINSRSYKKPLERRVFEHSRNGKVNMTLYRQSKDVGNWNKYDTQAYDNIDRITPPRLNGSNGNIAMDEHIDYEASNSEQLPPSSSSEEGKIATYVIENTLIEDVQSAGSNGNTSSINVAGDDAKKLAHIAKIIEHQTGRKIDNDQLISLALQLLIEGYEQDLRELNNEYLRDQVDIFE
ncbi:MAG: hypothetical protein ACI865_001649 [Flavobacteriaceae bacterium]|jgi:hypothetical protein